MHLVKSCEEGTLSVQILRGDKILSEDKTEGPYEGVTCIWGNPSQSHLTEALLPGSAMAQAAATYGRRSVAGSAARRPAAA